MTSHNGTIYLYLYIAGEVTIYSPGASPSRAPLASDRFSSPVSGTARRRLFPATASSSPSTSNQVLTAADGHSPAIKQQIITFQQGSTDDGRPVSLNILNYLISCQ